MCGGQYFVFTKKLVGCHRSEGSSGYEMLLWDI